MFKIDLPKLKKEDLHSYLIYRAAQKLGVRVSIIGYREAKKPFGGYFWRPIFEVEKNKRKAIICGNVTQNTSYLGMQLAVDKFATNQILNSHNFPVPEQRVIKKKADLEELFKRHSKVVIKPQVLRCGKGVLTENLDLGEAIKSYQSLKRCYRRLIAEEQVSGKDFRVLVIGYKVVAVLERIPPFVEGDGQSTIMELIEKENHSPLRKEGIVLKKIKVDRRIKLYLKSKGFSLKSVPPKGTKVQISNVANISAGGIGKDVSSQIHPTNKKLAIAAARLLNLDIAGIDIIAPSIKEPITKNGGKIIEINGGPDITIHYAVALGKKINPAEAIIKMVLNL